MMARTPQPSIKTTSRPKAKPDRSNGLKPEYSFDYTKAKPNRFASSVRGESLAVLLDPDVARVFQNAESVNTVLRALMTTMPARRKRSTPIMGKALLPSRPRNLAW